MCPPLPKLRKKKLIDEKGRHAPTPLQIKEKKLIDEGVGMCPPLLK